MVEAADHTLWFGTAEGVVSYDGTNWRHYTAQDGLEADRISILRCAGDGTLYAGTDNGVFCFRSGRWARIFPSDPGQQIAIRSLVCGSDGSLWVAFKNYIAQLKADGGKIHTNSTNIEFATKSFPNLAVVSTPEDVPSHGEVSTLYEDRDNRIWYILSSGDLVRFDPNQMDRAKAWRVFPNQNASRKKPATFPYSIFQTTDGKLWIGTNWQDAGINSYNEANDEWTHFDLSNMFGTDSVVRSIVQTSDGALWVGGFAKVFRYADGKWKLYRSPEFPVSSSRISLLETRSGDLWLLGLGDDVQRIDFRGRRWSKYEGLNFQCDGADGSQWFLSVDDHVVRYDGKHWWRFGPDDGLMASPYVILCTPNGDLWAAGSENNKTVLAQFDGQKWKRIPLNRPDLDFASLIDARAVIATADGGLWFGTYVDARGGGILQYSPGKGPPTDDRAWTVHLTTETKYSYGIASAKDGSMLSGYYRGLTRYFGGEWRIVDDTAIDALCQSHAGEVWVGTRGRGVYRYDGGKPIYHTTKDGLAANGITALLSDKEAGLWVGTSKAISRFDGEEWVTNVFPAQGLAIAREGGGLKQSGNGAIWINQSSREWTRRTLPGSKLPEETSRKFFTIRFCREVTSPKTSIIDPLLEVAQPGNVVYSWRGQVPWFRSPENDLHFSWRLDGSSWSKFSAEKHHVFLSLPTGRHTFEVRARDRDLNIEPVPAALDFVVVPPIWRAPWFLALMLTLIALITMQTARVIRRDQRLHGANQLLIANTGELERKKTSLEQEIIERKRMEAEAERLHKKLLDASREAGMAEIAINVLHNVGNVLNSVNVSVAVIGNHINELKVSSLAKTADLLTQHATDDNFLKNNEKGRRIPAFVKLLSTHFEQFKNDGQSELKSLAAKIDQIKEIVATQQAYAYLKNTKEKVRLATIIDDAIRMLAREPSEGEVEFIKEHNDALIIEVDRYLIIEILINLIQNAASACKSSTNPGKRVIIRTETVGPDIIRISVIDNGIGIPPENIYRIFNFDFTTHKNSRGFGLHGCANTAKQLGGKITCHSDGPGKGATFAIEIPV